MRRYLASRDPVHDPICIIPRIETEMRPPFCIGCACISERIESLFTSRKQGIIETIVQPIVELTNNLPRGAPVGIIGGGARNAIEAFPDLFNALHRHGDSCRGITGR